MNLWIRSQDKNVLLVINTVGVAENDRKIIVGFGIDGKVKATLGDYKTEQRALEVLGNIQEALLGINCLEDLENKKLYSRITQNMVYEMPKE